MTTTEMHVAAAVTVDKCNDDETAADMTLFKYIGLKIMLDPGTGGRWFRTVFVWLVRAGLVVQFTQIIGMYASTKDLPRFSTLAMLEIYGLTCAFKGIVLATNADRLWAVLNVARYQFTVCSHQRPTKLRETGAVMSTMLRVFAGFNSITVLVWIVTPLFLENSYVQIVHQDGTAGFYRSTINNLWLPGMSESLYNWLPVWTAIYVTEVVLLILNMVTVVMFDSYLITVCFAFKSQLHTLVSGYETVGHQRLAPQGRSDNGPAEDSIKNTQGKNDDGDMGCLDYYEELIVHIRDNQNIIEKYEEFLEIVRGVVIFHVAGCWTLIVGMLFIIALFYVMNEPFELVMRIVCGFCINLTQLYIYCYSFNNIEITKLSLNFGLYSSNWTAMSLKFKRTLLLAMNMNSAHTRVMKLSPNSIINLEMFTRVMKTAYTVLSVLINTVDK